MLRNVTPKDFGIETPHNRRLQAYATTTQVPTVKGQIPTLLSLYTWHSTSQVLEYLLELVIHDFAVNVKTIFKQLQWFLILLLTSNTRIR